MKYLDLVKTVDGTGTDLDPFKPSQVFGGADIDDNLSVKGEFDNAGVGRILINLGASDRMMQNWLPDEPFRIKNHFYSCDAPFQMAHPRCTIKGGIIDTSRFDISSTQTRLINCWYVVQSTSPRIESDTDIKGSFIRSVDRGIIFTIHGTNTGEIQDTIFQVEASDPIQFDLNKTLNNCAMNKAPSGTGIATLNNCQTDWIPPTMPAWDAPKEEFDAALLSVGINTPPQPGFGAPDYTGYETGLWGNPRTGIGAMYFEAPTPPTPDDVFTARMDAKFSNQKKVTDLQNNVTKMGPITTAKDGRIKGGSKIDYTFNG